MAAQEKSGNEILLEQLAKHVAHLSREAKAKESIVKELNEQIKIAERESASKIEKARAEAEREIDALQKAVAPLKDLQATCDGLRKDIEKLKREKIEAVTAVKEARSGAIKEADATITKSSAKLARLQDAIDECKRKVATL